MEGDSYFFLKVHLAQIEIPVSHRRLAAKTTPKYQCINMIKVYLMSHVLSRLAGSPFHLVVNEKREYRILLWRVL